MRNCKNCGTGLHDLYCSRCGQKAEVERVTFSHIWHGIVHFFTHAEKGFLFTSWQMLKTPGTTVNYFIEGRRKNYQPPVSYFLIWNGIYLLFILVIQRTFGGNKGVNFGEYFGTSSATQFAISHLNIALGLILPIQALYFWMVIVYKRNNYFESLVAMLYGIGTLLLWQTVFVFIAVIFYLVSGVSLNIQLSDLFKVAYMSWFVFDFVKLVPVKGKIVRGIIFLILALGTFTLWRMYGFPKVAELFF